MADLDSYGKREEHARSLARHYGLAPHGVDLAAAGPSDTGPGVPSVAWIDAPARLIRAGLVSREQVEALLAAHAEPATRHAGLKWTDAAGTRWMLCTNGGRRGDEYGLWLTALYPDDREELPAAAAMPRFVRAVERLVRRATGRPVRFVVRRGAPR